MLKNLKRLLPDLIGFKSKRRIIVIESDDWGSIRIPSKEVYQKHCERHFENYNSPYYKFDGIARKADLENTFEELAKIKGGDGRSPVITANTVMANPDFAQIEKSNFQSYFYKDLHITLKDYEKGLFETWMEGLNAGVFKPQFHGREHVNVPKWLNRLQLKDSLYLEAFKYGVYAVDSDLKSNKKNLTAAFDARSEEDQKFMEESVLDGLRIFKDHFSFKSDTMIAPSYTWFKGIEHAAAQGGVSGIQGIRFQKYPEVSDVSLLKRIHYLGQRNELGQFFLVRNVFFEPCLGNAQNVFNDSLKRIEACFKMNNVAIISMHRLNLVGRQESDNHESNLQLFKQLLLEVVKKWPDVEFKSSDELLALMKA